MTRMFVGYNKREQCDIYFQYKFFSASDKIYIITRMVDFDDIVVVHDTADTAE